MPWQISRFLDEILGQSRRAPCINRNMPPEPACTVYSTISISCERVNWMAMYLKYFINLLVLLPFVSDINNL